MKITLNSAGMRDLLVSKDVAAATLAAAEAVRDSLGTVVAHDGEVDVLTGNYRTDRANAAVTLAHPAGLGLEAVHGHLGRAASSVGLEFKAGDS